MRLATRVHFILHQSGIMSCLLVWLMCSAAAKAFAFQTLNDTVNKTPVDSAVKKVTPLTVYVTDKLFDKGEYIQADTSMDYYHYYLPGFYHNFKNLGNAGSPGQQMYYHASGKTGFSPGIYFLDSYASDKDRVRYYNTRRPYSSVFFVMGSKEEQVLNVKHTQNIGRPWNFGLNYTNISSTGFYQRQKTRGNNLLFHSHYESKNRRYGNFGNFIYHNTVIEENGGLYADVFFEGEIEDRKDALPVSLQNANNTFRKKSWFFKHYLNFGKREEMYDVKDSITRKVVSPVLRLSHTFSFEKKIFGYRDAHPDSGQYLLLFNYNKSAGPRDTIKDSLNVKIFENTLALTTVDFTDFTGHHYGLKNIYASAFIRRQDIARLTHNDNFDTAFANTIAGANVQYRFLKRFSAGGYADKVLDGFNKDDHYYEGYAEYYYGRTEKDSWWISDHRLRINSFHQIKRPDWIFSNYFSDQLHWRNEFLSSSYSGQSISYSSDKWGIQAGITQNFYKNPVYFSVENRYSTDTVFLSKKIIPVQREDRLTINQAYISKHLRLWKFHLRSAVYFQETDNELIVALPDFITYNSLYFESFMLRKAVYGQLGFDFYYHSLYNASFYSPFLKQFYSQGEKNIGGYPFFDFFINFKIKSVRAFFKLTHINSGYFGNTYYLIPHYPQPDRAYHIGINWRFLD